MNRFTHLFGTLTLLLALIGAARATEAPRQVIARAALTEDAAAQRALIVSLTGQGDEAIAPLFAAWRADSLFLFTAPSGEKISVQLTGDKDAAETQAALRIDTGLPLTEAAGQPLRLKSAELTAVGHTSALRRAMKAVLDLIDLGAADPTKRLKAVQTLGQAQAADKLPVLQNRLSLEQDAKVLVALREAVALIKLKDADDAVKLAALGELREMHTLSSHDFLVTARKDAETRQKPELMAAAQAALDAVASHRTRVDAIGTVFRGLSLGSILLVGALGLAITFGLMGVINMAHGEMIAIGAYTTYLVQNVFGDGLALSPFGLSLSLPGLHATGWTYQSYFLVALPMSFLTAAIAGILLERSVIQFLYRRPLESLLATWGVSLVLQQVFKLVFGSNNVSVSSPVYLSGNWTVFDIIFGWNRVFVIGFAVVIVFGVWLVLNKTSLGLLIRAVMQNRAMASCMGVRTTRVNMLTFGLGSGLAGLAGAFLSQIGNVGPTLGQSYIIDSFMVVVVGGVGSIVGTVISAFGIGSIDQALQQYTGNPVLGKILVLGAIILFLQWRPAGLFVTRSRSLED